MLQTTDGIMPLTVWGIEVFTKKQQKTSKTKLENKCHRHTLIN